MALTEDLAPFFDPAGFAVTGLWNGATSVNLIVDHDYLEPLGNIAQGSAPVAVCAAADVAGIKHGDTIAVGTITYKVRGVEPDGTGIVTLRLEEQ